MSTMLRRAVLATTVATSLTLGATPASAAVGVLTFTGVAHIDCFGCGTSTGTADLCLTGFFAGGVRPGCTVANAVFSASEGAGLSCVFTGSASGSVTGGVNLSFNWQRVGALAVIVTSGGIAGEGFAVFEVLGPAGIPCGGPLDARFAGFLAGT